MKRTHNKTQIVESMSSTRWNETFGMTVKMKLFDSFTSHYCKDIQIWHLQQRLSDMVQIGPVDAVIFSSAAELMSR